jgi:hypothetical protein
MPKREFGEIPSWAKHGPVTLANYSFRAELYCKLAGRKEHPTIELGTTECELWRSYYQYHLGGYPQAMWMLVQNQIKEMTVPEEDPELFDPSWIGPGPTATLVEPPRHGRFNPLPPDPLADPLTGFHPVGTVLSDFTEASKLYGKPLEQGEPLRERAQPIGRPPEPTGPKDASAALADAVRTGKIKFNRDEKFDIQLNGGLIAERRLGEIFVARRIEKIELKTETWQWEQTGNIAIEYMRDDKPTCISVTEADYWVHELRRDGATLVYLMFPIDRLKELARTAIRNGRKATKAGDGGRQSLALIPLIDILAGGEFTTGAAAPPQQEDR